MDVASLVLLIIGLWLAVYVFSFDFGIPYLAEKIMRKLGLYGGVVNEVSPSNCDLDNPIDIGSSVEVIETFVKVGNQFDGYVKLNGVRWKAKSLSNAFEKGTIVVVTKMDNLVLEVK